MKNSRIAIRPFPSTECIVALAPTIAALKKKYPGSTVGIVASENLREASSLLLDLDFFVEENEETLAEKTIDLCGIEQLETAIESKNWKAYFLATKQLGSGNPYHLIDLLRKVTQLDTIDVNFELATPVPTETLPEGLINPAGLRIGICTASLSQASVEAALEGLSRISSGVDVFLLGTIKDRARSSEAASRWDGKLSVHDLCGHLSFSSQAAVLQRCDLTVAGPGLNAMLSSGFGTFTVCIDETPARGPYLYPYGHGHLVIQNKPADQANNLLAPLLQDVVTYAITANSGNVPTLEQWQQFSDSLIPSHLGKIRILATQRIEIVFKETESFTELYQRPLLFAGSEIFDVLQTFYRLLWEHSLNKRNITTFDVEILHQDTMPILADMLKPFEQLYELGNFGRIYSGSVRDSLGKGDVVKAKQESVRLQEVEELIQSLVRTQPFFAPLYEIHRQRQRLMEDDNPICLAEEMTTLFAELQERVLVMLDLAKSLFHTVFENESALNAAPAQEGGSND